MKSIYFFTLSCLFLSSYCQSSLGSSSSLSKCESDCNNNSDCMEACRRHKDYLNQIALIVTICIIGVCLCSCGICMVSSHPRFKKFRLLFNGKYRNIKKLYNATNQQIMSRDEFVQHVYHIVQLFNQSKQKHNFTSTLQGGQNKEIAIVSAEEVNNFLYSIQIKGEDNEGDWAGSGSIVCSDVGVICWFMKQYQQVYKKSKHRNRKLIYKSEPSTLNALQGKLFDIQNANEGSLSKQTWRLQVPAISQNTIKHSQSNMVIFN